MSNIVPFPNRWKDVNERQKMLRDREEQRNREERQNETSGHAARRALGTLRRRIAPAERIQLAKNMAGIFSEFAIQASALPWQQDYASIESFHNDVHRMRLISEPTENRRTMAHPLAWLRLLRYIHQHLAERGQPISLDFLADRLTRGTGFHPTRKEISRSEKLFYLLYSWADEVSNQRNLLQLFTTIAQARVEYFKHNLRDIHDSFYTVDELPKHWSQSFGDFYEFEDRRGIELGARLMRELSDAEWDEVVEWIPDEDIWWFRDTRASITAWKRHFDVTTTLTTTDGEPSADHDIAHLPHWFIGYNRYSDFRNVVTGEEDDWLGGLVRKKGTEDPWRPGVAADWAWGCSYLVLYPDRDHKRIIPYIYEYAEEGTTFVPLGEHDLRIESAEGWIREYYQPKPIGTTTISRPLSERIEESLNEIREAWLDTAAAVLDHPYLQWKKMRDELLDQQIKRTIERTESKSN